MKKAIQMGILLAVVLDIVVLGLIAAGTAKDEIRRREQAARDKVSTMRGLQSRPAGW